MVRASRVGAAALALAIATALALALARLAGAAVPAAALLGALGALLGVIGWGVFSLRSGVFARPILAASSTGNRLALTFDDGPDPEHTRAVLDLLESRGHRGTFFVIGARAEKQAALVDEIARRGHGLGNHSFAHSYLTPLRSPSRLAEELDRASSLLARASGAPPRWFRPPVGLLSPPVVEAARRAHLELVGWTASARDGVASATVEKAAARLRPHLRAGAILVLHDAVERGARAPIAAAVLAGLLDELDRRGLKSVPLDELLGRGAH